MSKTIICDLDNTLINTNDALIKFENKFTLKFNINEKLPFIINNYNEERDILEKNVNILERISLNKEFKNNELINFIKENNYKVIIATKRNMSIYYLCKIKDILDDIIIEDIYFDMLEKDKIFLYKHFNAEYIIEDNPDIMKVNNSNVKLILVNKEWNKEFESNDKLNFGRIFTI